MRISGTVLLWRREAIPTPNRERREILQSRNRAARSKRGDRSRQKEDYVFETMPSPFRKHSSNLHLEITSIRGCVRRKRYAKPSNRHPRYLSNILKILCPAGIAADLPKSRVGSISARNSPRNVVSRVLKMAVMKNSLLATKHLKIGSSRRLLDSLVLGN